MSLPDTRFWFPTWYMYQWVAMTSSSFKQNMSLSSSPFKIMCEIFEDTANCSTNYSLLYVMKKLLIDEKIIDTKIVL